jgi:hypothetical protein
MYLRDLRLEWWGCHRAFAADFAAGLNICAGRNEAGKSTLYQAILRGLTQAHTSRDEGIMAFRP